MNGWYIYHKPGEYKQYDLSHIRYNTEIDLNRKDEIKFDVNLKDIGS